MPALAAALLLSALTCHVPVAAAPAAGKLPPGTLDRLATALEGEPAPVRADFAAVALDQVILAHELEFERLSVPGQVSRRELAKQMRWAAALRDFLEELYAARDALDAGADPQLLVSPPAPVQLLVGARLVPLTSPRIDDPAVLEAAIVEAYCGAFTCDPAMLEPPGPVAPPPAAAAGGWSFRDGRGSTYETGDGLGFMFPDVRHRSAKEQAIRQVREELLQLVAVLTGERAAGRAVHWASVAVDPPAGGDPRPLPASASGGQVTVRTSGGQITVRTSGATLRLDLPALARAPGVLALTREWIRARVEGRDYRQLIPRADLMLAGLL